MAGKPSKVNDLKEFFGDVRPVTNAELLELRKTDPNGFDELARLAREQLVLRKGKNGE